MTWRYVDAFVAGTSHRDLDVPCQDRCACSVVSSRDGGDVLITVVSDGAGSADHGEIGAQTVCDELIDAVRAAVAESSDLDRVGDDVLRSWFLSVRETLRTRARAGGADIRHFAATALLAVAGDHQTLCARIGDGGIVVRRSPDAAFEVALWPDGGEYANETYFVTDDAAAERVAIARFDGVSDIIVFSDGLQHLALEVAARRAYPAFFTPLVATVRASVEPAHALAARLGEYLNSGALNARTSDDKSLVVGCRMARG